MVNVPPLLIQRLNHSLANTMIYTFALTANLLMHAKIQYTLVDVKLFAEFNQHSLRFMGVTLFTWLWVLSCSHMLGDWGVLLWYNS